jgi:hypothetical protein
MDDLTLVRELGDETPLLNHAGLAPARERLLAGMTGRAPVRLLKRRSRFTIVGGTAIGLAAAIATVITLAPLGDQAPNEQGTVAGQPPDAKTDAVQVLRLAAARTLSQPQVEPRADQFVYARTEGKWGTREFWQSVDGTQDGALINSGGTTMPFPGCRDGRSAMVKGDQVVPGVFEDCVPRPGYRSDLPTNTDAMLAYLDQHASGEPGDVNARGKDVLFLIEESYLPAATRAALFEAAGKVPGLKVVPNTADGAGRPGIGITWPVPPGSASAAKPMVLVFDASTYEFLGTPDSAVTNLSIVDHSGQRP